MKLNSLSSFSKMESRNFPFRLDLRNVRKGVESPNELMKVECNNQNGLEERKKKINREKRDSKIQRFKDSKIQRFKDSIIQ